MKINTEITTKEQAEKLIEKLKNFNEPLQFGRWIKDDTSPNWLAFYNKENNLLYGINGSGNWMEHESVGFNPNNCDRNRYATDQEILDGLSEMALKLGYDGPFSYDFKNIEFKEWMKNKTILKDGVWLSNEPTTLESLEKRIADVVGNKRPKTDKERIELLENKVNELKELLSNPIIVHTDIINSETMELLIKN